MIWNELGTTQMLQGKHKEALRAFDRCSRISPEPGPTHAKKGTV